MQKARDQVDDVVSAKRDEVIFTSGATESDNIAILGLQEAALKQGKLYVITSTIEHILEPFGVLQPKSRPPSRTGSLAAARQSGKPFEGRGERRGRRCTKPEGSDAAARLSHDSGISRRLNDYGRKVDD